MYFLLVSGMIISTKATIESVVYVDQKFMQIERGKCSI